MSLELFLPYITVAAITGAGLITGLLFAFSNFVMRALAQLESDQGILAMQQINEKIINPLFLFLFLGTPLLCVVIAFFSIFHIDRGGSVFLLIGALSYIMGPFGVTVLYNVPLNDKLAQVEETEANEMWARYQIVWQRWNHIRTYIGIVAIIFLALGLRILEQ